MKLLRELNKRGSEKPIEIFIALFVILAVAMVLLQMFGNQVSEQGENLQELADENKLKTMSDNVDTFCRDKCGKADSPTGMAEYCLAKYRTSVDLNNNGRDGDYSRTFTVSGVCEDSIYCFTKYDCKELYASDCIEILCDYYRERFGASGEAATDRLKRAIVPGSCYEGLNADDTYDHWYNQLEDLEVLQCD